MTGSGNLSHTTPKSKWALIGRLWRVIAYGDCDGVFTGIISSRLLASVAATIDEDLNLPKVPDLWVPNPSLHRRHGLGHRDDAVHLRHEPVHHRPGAVHDRLDEPGADDGIPTSS